MCFHVCIQPAGGKALLKGDKSIKAGIIAADPGAPPAGLQVQLCCSPADIQCMASVKGEESV